MSRYKLIKVNDLYRLIDTSNKSEAIRYTEAKNLLYDFYRKGLDKDIIEPILELIKDDMYFYLISEIYEQNTTLDWLADDIKADATTIKRNKKRLTLIIYNLWEEAKQNE